MKGVGVCVNLFLNTFTNRIDRKGRISVPAPFRFVLSKRGSDGVVAMPSFKFPAVQCCASDWMDRLAGLVDEYAVFSNEQDDMTAVLFASARLLSLDSDGRIVLPEELIEHANLSEEAAFVGRSKTFEIWQPAAFRDYQAGARKRVASGGMTLPSRQSVEPK